MLKGIRETVLEIECSGCGSVYYTDVNGITLKKNEFNEYQNLALKCTDCGDYELFNVNIPIDDIEEGIETGELPVDEEVQRHYVRILQRLVRADLKGGDSE
ncbi:hypothetical protein SAMN05192559_104105 [Halobacillus karajensis]|uniref:hypothetical protein n=1 Tax=Halobacillus karajensis TaxID=195088 RepID=UPI0008A772F7|nr:hypothetical protein [Halobacillus karajensis]SEH78562.1 hypothetical protein SAMN05192559_104105 [Halobacillus karajensis]